MPSAETGSDYRNADLNTYVLTAHYLTDNVKVGLLYQLIHDPKTISAAFLVGGISDQGFFAGEALGYGAWDDTERAGRPRRCCYWSAVRFWTHRHVRARGCTSWQCMPTSSFLTASCG